MEFKINKTIFDEKRKKYNPKKIEMTHFINKLGFLVIKVYHWNDKRMNVSWLGSNLYENEQPNETFLFENVDEETKNRLFNMTIIPKNKEENILINGDGMIPIIYGDKYETNIFFVNQDMFKKVNNLGE